MGIRINGSTSGYTELSAGSKPGNNTITLPESNGAAGQFLQVGANGVTTWATAINLIVQTDASFSEPVIGSACTSTNPIVLSGTTPYTYSYQWQFQASGGSSFSDVSGATSVNYTVPETISSVATEGGQLRCVVTVTDSSTPAITTTSTSAGVVVVTTFGNLPPSKLGYLDIDTGAIVDVTVDSSTSNRVIGYNHNYVVKEDGTLWGAGAGVGGPNAVPTKYNSRVTTHDRAGRQIKQIINGAFHLDQIVVLYDDGSVKDTQGTINTFSAGKECVMLCGGGNVQSNYTCCIGIMKDGTIHWFGTNGMLADDASNTSVSTAQGRIRVTPAGVNAVKAVLMEVSYSPNNNGFSVAVLGNDKKVYVMCYNKAPSGFPTTGSWSTNGFALLDVTVGSSTFSNYDWTDIGAGSKVDSYTESQFNALRSDGTLWWASTSQTLTQHRTETDYMTAMDWPQPYYNNYTRNGIALSTTRNEIIVFDGGNVNRRRTLTGTTVATDALWNKLAKNRGAASQAGSFEWASNNYCIWFTPT